jgi:hypothetical protein
MDQEVKHYISTCFCGRTLPKSSCIDTVASGDTGNADLVTKRYRRVYKEREIPLGKTFPMWAAWGISGAAKTTAANVRRQS